MSELLSPDIRRAVAMGPIVRMQVHEKKSRKAVPDTSGGWLRSLFAPPIWIDTTYIDWEALKDPVQSDFPLMQKAVLLGLYEPPRETDEPYGLSFTWRRTPAGDALHLIPTPAATGENIDG